MFELLQHTYIIFKEHTDIRHLVKQHYDTLDSHTKSKTTVLIRGLMFTFFRTAGSTIPHPIISNQPRTFSNSVISFRVLVPSIHLPQHLAQ